ncbi:MAG: hypothetical protein HRU15_02570, partial [Planctomycetes bacterium]|nr:hypothetical protein [Planctomycetota bacterium]
YVKLSFATDAYIPDDYLETPSLKFEVHKAIDDCHRISEVETLCASLRDRFGPPVIPLQRLFKLKAIRIRCHEHGIKRIEMQDRHIRLHISDQIPDLDADTVPELVHIQADEGMVTLFMRQVFGQDELIDLISRLMKINMTLKVH